MENVRVQLEPPEGFMILKEIPCEKLPYNETGSVFIILRYPDSIKLSVGMYYLITSSYFYINSDPANFVSHNSQ